MKVENFRTCFVLLCPLSSNWSLCWSGSCRGLMTAGIQRTIHVQSTIHLLVTELGVGILVLNAKCRMDKGAIRKTKWKLKMEFSIKRQSVFLCSCWDLTTDVTLACEDHTTSSRVTQPPLSLLLRILPLSNAQKKGCYFSGIPSLILPTLLSSKMKEWVLGLDLDLWLLEHLWC